MRNCQPIEKRAADQAGQACTILSVKVWIHKNGLSIELVIVTNAVKRRGTKTPALFTIRVSSPD